MLNCGQTCLNIFTISLIAPSELIAQNFSVKLMTLLKVTRYLVYFNKIQLSTALLRKCYSPTPPPLDS